MHPLFLLSFWDVIQWQLLFIYLVMWVPTFFIDPSPPTASVLDHCVAVCFPKWPWWHSSFLITHTTPHLPPLQPSTRESWAAPGAISESAPPALHGPSWGLPADSNYPGLQPCPHYRQNSGGEKSWIADSVSSSDMNSGTGSLSMWLLKLWWHCLPLLPEDSTVWCKDAQPHFSSLSSFANLQIND